MGDNAGFRNKRVAKGEVERDSINLGQWFKHIFNFNNPHKVTAEQILPDQRGHTNDFLRTDGSSLSWVSVVGTLEIYSFVRAGSGNVQLDSVSEWEDKLTIVKKTTKTGYITILPDGAETIDGGSSFIVDSPKGCVILFNDGTTDINVISFF